MFLSRYWRKTQTLKVRRRLRRSSLCSGLAKMELLKIFSGGFPVFFFSSDHQRLQFAHLQYLPFLIAQCRFGLHLCPVCMGDPQDPVSLPCDHVYCLGCIKAWLCPGQMYCPLCIHEVDETFQVCPSEDLRLVGLYSQT